MADVDYAALAFRVLAKRLRDTAAGDLRKELGDAINDAADPAVANVRSLLPEHMPDRYAEILEPDLRLSVVRNFATRSPGVRITGTNRGLGGVKRRRLHRLESGILAHPLFGNRRRWYDQTDGVKADFFSGPLSAAQPQVREAIVRAMADVADKLTRKA